MKWFVNKNNTFSLTEEAWREMETPSKYGLQIASLHPKQKEKDIAMSNIKCN